MVDNKLLYKRINTFYAILHFSSLVFSTIIVVKSLPWSGYLVFENEDGFSFPMLMAVYPLLIHSLSFVSYLMNIINTEQTIDVGLERANFNARRWVQHLFIDTLAFSGVLVVNGMDNLDEVVTGSSVFFGFIGLMLFQQDSMSPLFTYQPHISPQWFALFLGTIAVMFAAHRARETSFQTSDQHYMIYNSCVPALYVLFMLLLQRIQIKFTNRNALCPEETIGRAFDDTTYTPRHGTFSAQHETASKIPVHYIEEDDDGEEGVEHGELELNLIKDGEKGQDARADGGAKDIALTALRKPSVDARMGEMEEKLERQLAEIRRSVLFEASYWGTSFCFQTAFSAVALFLTYHRITLDAA